MKKNKNELAKEKIIRNQEIADKLKKSSINDEEKVFELYKTNINGLSTSEVENRIEEYGNNEIDYGDNQTTIERLIEAFVNPFTIVLAILAAVSFITDYVIADPGDKNLRTVIIIVTMVTISGLLRFIQEGRSNEAGKKLKAMINTTATVIRDGNYQEIRIEDIVPGDIIRLTAGDMIPADIRILSAKDLFVSQASMTGESEPVEKFGSLQDVEKAKTSSNYIEYENLAFMGTNVVSGAATAVVLLTGSNTYISNIASAVTGKREVTSFDKGVNSVSMVLIKFMMVMVPIVFVINGFTKGNWVEAFLFGISVAVGLTPEMLPMIVTTNLARGAVTMSKNKTIVKNLNSIQNFGAIDVLCTDKTGTLTEDEIILERYLDIQGNEDIRVLRHAYLVSRFQTGLKNLLDVAILNHGMKERLEEVDDSYQKIDEIPFDFSRRRMSVVLKDRNDKVQLITKGAVEEMLEICDFAEYKGEVVELSKKIKKKIISKAEELNEIGMRVIAVAQKTGSSLGEVISVKDEQAMVFMGYIGFLDPPKASSKAAIAALHEYGVEVKVLTGDSDKVTKYVCSQVGIEVTDKILLGSEIEEMTDEKLKKKVEKYNIFAKLSPGQKARVVSMLKENGHVVGFMGDGINDAPSMKKADVGISVDTAVDIAKESADIILLEKDLMVLEKGIIQGRKTFANIIKYIKMTASSNFGNMFSVLVASALLPFLPMIPVQILILNLIYDISCVAIPWDNVDAEFIEKPRQWDANSIGKFMLWIGPVSSVFDIATYIMMFFIICPLIAGGSYFAAGTDKTMFMMLFNAGWFVESLWSQSLVIHMIRSPKVPFIQSRASKPVLISTMCALTVGTIIPFTKLGSILQMYPMPAVYFIGLIIIILAYMLLVTFVKKLYIKRYGDLL